MRSGCRIVMGGEEQSESTIRYTRFERKVIEGSYNRYENPPRTTKSDHLRGIVFFSFVFLIQLYFLIFGFGGKRYPGPDLFFAVWFALEVLYHSLKYREAPSA